ncbi:hypothetical protein [Hymenobacter glacieicola]|uniref:Uncharacterized protein n=1 Tax=Hymenobacter glacieicola TaxID=1562124 RepID=A0ABQ1X5E0_9BACT|nr:hypothetical protein [Hymenobacter glacieicola]GGG60792.1 hypothetical protein GCM10011378_41030 [Hymenobacter glacieicola]
MTHALALPSLTAHLRDNPQAGRWGAQKKLTNHAPSLPPEQVLALFEAYYPAGDLQELGERVGMGRREVVEYASRHEIKRVETNTPLARERAQQQATKSDKQQREDEAEKQRVDAYAEGTQRNMIAVGLLPKWRKATDEELAHITKVQKRFAENGYTPYDCPPDMTAAYRAELYGSPEPPLYTL